MAASLLLLLDDITSVLDDVATITKVAAAKTAGVVGDDLALNAKQIAGVQADRELPVVWAVARGSAVNKLILVPIALAVSLLAPRAIVPLLMAGGAYLCYEGVEKILHAFMPEAAHSHADADDRPRVATPPEGTTGEQARIAGAIRTDFILSAEIMVIALGVAAGQPLVVQVGVLAAVAALMTVGVYGLVAAIIKIDDLGLLLARRRGASRSIGLLLLRAAPALMRLLSIAGTVAMFLVGGGIVAHGLPWIHRFVEGLIGHVPDHGSSGGPWWLGLAMKSADLLVGVLVGVVAAGGAVAWRTTARPQALRTLEPSRRPPSPPVRHPATTYGNASQRE
jgi:predicted DNA repair protein MutK